MRKVVIVTSLASSKSILKYAKTPLIGVEKGIELIAKNNLPIALGFGDFDTMEYESALRYIKANQLIRLKPEKDVSDTEAAVDYMQKLGFDEITILCSLKGRYDHSHALLLLIKKYPKCKIILEDDNNYISYLGKGTHIVQKGEYKYIGFVGFPEAVITMENARYPVKKLKIEFCTTKAISNELLERMAEIEVHKGAVLCIQSKDVE